MINILKSEFYKTKHTWLPLVHLLMPAIYAITFYMASKITGLKNFDSNDIIQIYLVILGAGLPVLIGAITSKVVDMEMAAGHFQTLLTTIKSREKAYTGKLIALLLGLLFSLTLAICIFGFLFGHQSLNDWAIELLLIFFGSLSTYMIHLWVSIKLGSGASIGLGFVETLLAFLSITSLGDKIWYFLPCTWASRLAATYLAGKKIGDNLLFYKELSLCLYVAIPLTTIIFVSSNIWFRRWDAKSVNS